MIISDAFVVLIIIHSIFEECKLNTDIKKLCVVHLCSEVLFVEEKITEMRE